MGLFKCFSGIFDSRSFGASRAGHARGGSLLAGVGLPAGTTNHLNGLARPPGDYRWASTDLLDRPAKSFRPKVFLAAFAACRKLIVEGRYSPGYLVQLTIEESLLGPGKSRTAVIAS